MIKIAAVPLIIYGEITENDVAVDTITVKVRNNTTNEVGTYQTDSNGLYIADLSDTNNFPSGWADGQQITIYTIYSNFEGQETITIALPIYGYQQDIELESVTDSNLIAGYCTVQDVYDELDAKTASDIPSDRIIKAIRRAEGLIELKTGTFFTLVTRTDEVHTGDRYSLDISPDYLDTVASTSTLRRDSWGAITHNRVKTEFRPINSITSLSYNTAGATATDSWTALTEQTGSGGNFIVEDADAGVIDFLTVFPRLGKRSWKLTYVVGYDRDSTDRNITKMLKVVERLCILKASQAIISTKSTGSMFDSSNDVRIGSIEIKSGAMSSKSYLTAIEPEIKELWKELGEMGFEII